MKTSADEMRFDVDAGTTVHGRWLEGEAAVLVFAHGAGAGMDHAFMEGVSGRLAARDVATLRFDFPYIREGRPLPPRLPTLLPVVRAAVDAARSRAGTRPVWAGGKSMGGRVTSMADAEAPLPVNGLVFVGFPLHRRGAPARDRALHLAETRGPLRFVSGTRDRMAREDLLASTVETLSPRARLHLVEGADHGFDVLVRSGRTTADVMDEVADVIAGWIT